MMASKMQGALRTRYGSMDQLEVQTVDVPAPRAGEVLVRVKAVSLNTSDVEQMTGHPLYARVFGLRKPRVHILGTDLTGVVEQLGPGVTELAVGDEVLGDIMGHSGCLAEFACAPVKVLQKKPSWMNARAPSNSSSGGATSRGRAPPAQGHGASLTPGAAVEFLGPASGRQKISPPTAASE